MDRGSDCPRISAGFVDLVLVWKALLTIKMSVVKGMVLEGF